MPAYNAAKMVGEVVKGLHGLVDYVIVVDDGSSDDTAKMAAEARAEVVSHVKNQGLGAALRTGFRAALSKDCDFIVTLDADGQHSPGDVRKILVRLENNECDMVIGSRLIDRRQWLRFPPLRLVGNLILTGLTNLAVGRKVTTDSQSGYRAFRKDVLEAVTLTADRMAISSEIIVEVARRGFKIAEVPIEATYENEVSYQRFFRDPVAISLLLIGKLLKRTRVLGMTTFGLSRPEPESKD